ncbi:hypothetical protein SS05631_c14230 [Sinorhizobium sp. CCBAU 05631]|nr:hypothetical protein SS05631_c14230 [Sinorhizobium sp. CCBAU 05631]
MVLLLRLFEIQFSGFYQSPISFLNLTTDVIMSVLKFLKRAIPFLEPRMILYRHIFSPR